MTTTILCTHQKGGAGKTTLAVHLAAVLAGRGRTLLIDCDSQYDSFRFHTGQEPQEMLLTKAQPLRRLTLLWNPERKAIKKLARSESYDTIVIDMDTPLANMAQIVSQGPVDRILVPVNPQDLTLTHLPTVLEAIFKLGFTTGPAPRVMIVPLGRPREEALAAVAAAPLKPADCVVAPGVRFLPGETSRALSTRELVWSLPGCADLRPYFEELATTLG